MAEQSKV